MQARAYAAARPQPAERVAVGPATSTVVSSILPVIRDDAGLGRAFDAYRAALDDLGQPYEMIYVVSGDAMQALHALAILKERGERLKVVIVSRLDSEASAIAHGLRHAAGETILMLPPQLQVDPSTIPEVVAALEDCDLVLARRSDVVSSRFQKVQAAVFHRLIQSLFGHSFGDLVCRVRACRRPVLEEISGYGAQPHFLPLLASERGFKVREVDVRARGSDGAGGRLNLLSRARFSLDVLALYVVLRFIRKPLRFFGAIGLPIFALGFLFTASLAVGRIFYGVGLADRPALILGVLMIVLGIQVIALGLIGEIIIFASGKRLKEYAVERVVGPSDPM